jgi:putative acetyltransferase
VSEWKKGRIRTGIDADSGGVIRVIAGVFAEYEGCVLDVDSEEPELRTPASSFERFWVVESKGEIQGCIACVSRDGFVELKKLYLDASVRGGGFARTLVALVEEHARSVNLPRIELWSDTRFTDAHGLYSHLDYEKTGESRHLRDLSNTLEFKFIKDL